MEKFRKFDDPRCGVNPFIPLVEKSRPVWAIIPRIVSRNFLTLYAQFLSCLLFLIKVPFLFFVLSFHYICSYRKFVFIHPKLVRLFERITSYGNCRMLLSVFNFTKVQTRFHGSHPEFDYLKF